MLSTYTKKKKKKKFCCFVVGKVHDENTVAKREKRKERGSHDKH